MKLPNGYGGVVKLPGHRRKPWAVRISYVEEQPDGTVKRKRKYLEYFETQKGALAYLADYNKGLAVKEHSGLSNVLTFEQLYEKWKDWRWSFKKKPGQAALTSYNSAFHNFSSIHNRKITSLRTSDLQDCISAYSSRSKSTVYNMGVILRGMWKYAISNDYVDKDITQGLVYEFTAAENPMHTRFTDDEIKRLWGALGTVPNVDLVLIYIYSGMRPSELLEMRTENIHMAEQYMVGGVKTAAGRNRVIPIHNAILPLIQERMRSAGEYLVLAAKGNPYKISNYKLKNWDRVMTALGMDHVPHDGRYTFASLANSYGLNEIAVKIIMGHSIANTSGTSFKIGGSGDVTQNVYTEKTIQDLVDEVNRIPVIL